MKTFKFYLLGILFLSVVACNNATEQTDTYQQTNETQTEEQTQEVDLSFPAISPRAEVHQKIGITNVVIDYSRPAVRDRQIWGNLVPYDEVWRTGANAPTTVKFQHDVSVNGSNLAAGKYVLTTVPAENNNWEMIFHHADGQENEALRFNANAQSNDGFYEMMTFLFEDVTENSGNVVLAWENLKVGFDVEVETHQLVSESIDNAIAQAGDDDWSVYSRSARYLIERNERLAEAEEWVNKALEIEENWRNYFTQGLLKEQQGDISGAIESIEKAIEKGREDEEEFGAEGFLTGILERLRADS